MPDQMYEPLCTSQTELTARCHGLKRARFVQDRLCSPSLSPCFSQVRPDLPRVGQARRAERQTAGTASGRPALRSTRGEASHDLHPRNLTRATSHWVLLPCTTKFLRKSRIIPEDSESLKKFPSSFTSSEFHERSRIKKLGSLYRRFLLRTIKDS